MTPLITGSDPIDDPIETLLIDPIDAPARIPLEDTGSGDGFC